MGIKIKMKKILLTSLIIALSSASATAEVRPYIGMSINNFSMVTDEIIGTNLATGISEKFQGDTQDTGVAAGFTAGILMSDNGRINFSHFSGEEKDSEIFTATITSLSYDYSFNGSGVHRGWFLGAGISSVEIEAAESESFTSGTAKSTGLLLRGGYEYLFDNNFLIETGYNANLAEVDIKLNGKGLISGAEILAPATVSNFYLSVNYAF